MSLYDAIESNPQGSVASSIHDIKESVRRAAERSRRNPVDVAIIAITKTVSPELIMEAYNGGITHFGENRVQEAAHKVQVLSGLDPQPTWHMVGHLQTNKAKLAVRLFDVIQTVDSVRLAEIISREAEQQVPVLLQVNASAEDTKSGFSPDEVGPAVDRIARLPYLQVEGLMTIAPLTLDPEDARPCFRQLRGLRDSLGLRHLSMGMTEDFEIAIEEGATILRIGRGIFGERKG